MRCFGLSIFPLLLLAACHRLPNDADFRALPPDFQRGMNLACWGKDCFRSSELHGSLLRLHDNGARWISVVFTVYQNTPADSDLQLPAEAEMAAGLGQPIRMAQAHGFRITLKPHVDVRDGAWRGNIRPHDTRRWFERYTAFIATLARLADDWQIPQLVVGTELVGISSRDAEWRQLIREVRRVYSGKLLYAASWNEYEAVSFWDALDYIGVNAFFPLTNRRDPELIDLLAGWEYWLSRLSAWQRRVGKPVIFTEIGYTGRDGTTMHPYRYDTTAELDLQEQADAYRAALQTFPKIDWLTGAYWWYWPVRFAEHAGMESYVPYAKPAETVLRQAWQEDRR